MKTYNVRVSPKTARFIKEIQAREMITGRKRPQVHKILEKLLPNNIERYWRREYG